jgi:hypothetical protein
MAVTFDDGPVDSAAGARNEAALPQIIDGARQLAYCIGLLNSVSKVVPPSCRPRTRPSRKSSNASPTCPCSPAALQPCSLGPAAPEPYVIVDPAAEL